MKLLAPLLQDFTTPANTTVIADTDAAPGTLPTPAVFVPEPNPLLPTIDGNRAYIGSPNVFPLQTVTFRSVFTAGLPPLSAVLPVAVFYSFAADQTGTATGTLEFLNVLGVVVGTVPLFTESNGGNIQNVVNASGDALLALNLGAASLRVTVDATVTGPAANTPYPFTTTDRLAYLGEIIVRGIGV